MNENEGLIFYDRDSGVLIIGKDDLDRVRLVQLSSGTGGSLKFFEDGAFEILSQTTAKLADNIHSRSQDGMIIKSEGDLNIQSEGKITLKASEIIIEGTSSKEGVVIKNENGNMRFEASAGNLGIKGKNIAIAATRNSVITSKGNVHVVAEGGQVFIVEPKSKLIPTSALDIVNSVLTSFSGWV